MSAISREASFCQDASNCFRLGTDSLEALRALITEIKAGKADPCCRGCGGARHPVASVSQGGRKVVGATRGMSVGVLRPV